MKTDIVISEYAESELLTIIYDAKQEIKVDPLLHELAIKIVNLLYGLASDKKEDVIFKDLMNRTKLDFNQKIHENFNGNIKEASRNSRALRVRTDDDMSSGMSSPEPGRDRYDVVSPERSGVGLTDGEPSALQKRRVLKAAREAREKEVAEARKAEGATLEIEREQRNQEREKKFAEEASAREQRRANRQQQNATSPYSEPIAVESPVSESSPQTIAAVVPLPELSNVPPAPKDLPSPSVNGQLPVAQYLTLPQRLPLSPSFPAGSSMDSALSSVHAGQAQVSDVDLQLDSPLTANKQAEGSFTSS